MQANRGDPQGRGSGPARVAEAAVAYLGWIVNGLLALVALVAARGALLAIVVVLRLNPYLYRPIDSWSFVLLGVLCLAVMLYIEHYYRQARQSGLLLRRFVRVTLIELAVLALLGLLQYVVLR